MMLKKLLLDNKGQALIIVLLLMLVGGLIIAPFLGFMASGLKVGQVFEEKMDRLYAADAGIEDAIWKIQHDQLPDFMPYYLAETVNDKDVAVDAVFAQDTKGFLVDLLVKRYSGVHSDWAVVSEYIGLGTYSLTISYQGVAQKVFLEGIGAWFQGSYDILNDVSGITNDYPVFDFEVGRYKGGSAFIWEWTGSDKPEFGKQSGVYTRNLTFHFTPKEEPEYYISWADIASSNIGIVHTAITFETWEITAIATDSTTGKRTKIVAHISRRGEEPPYTVNILSWDIALDGGE